MSFFSPWKRLAVGLHLIVTAAFIESVIRIAPKDNDTEDGYDQRDDRRAGKNGIH
jgi:hypothetical protein